MTEVAQLGVSPMQYAWSAWREALRWEQEECRRILQSVAVPPSNYSSAKEAALFWGVELDRPVRLSFVNRTSPPLPAVRDVYLYLQLMLLWATINMGLSDRRLTDERTAP